MSDFTLGRQSFLALNANAHRSDAASVAAPTIHVRAKPSATGYVSESTLLSPPPVGPVCGSRLEQISRYVSRRANLSNSVSCPLLVSVSQWYSSSGLSSSEASSQTEPENRSGLRAFKKSFGDILVMIQNSRSLSVGNQHKPRASPKA